MKKSWAFRAAALVFCCLMCLPAARAEETGGEEGARPPMLTVALDAPGAVAYQRHFAVSPDTQSVDFGALAIQDYGVLTAFLDQLPQVRYVDMFATQIRAARCRELAERYPQIEFGWTIRFADHTVRTDATAFSTLHFSGDPPHTAQDLSVLRYCRRLRALDIGHNVCDDLSFLEDLSELRVLIIACNQIADLTPLAALSHLEYLEVFSNQVTDLTPLAGLDHLMDLNICYNNIADYSPLYGLKNLKRLWLFHSGSRKGDGKVPAQVVSALREALPQCQMDAVNMPTLGGWREHPHFDVIHRMMRSAVYEPFADSFPAEE